MSNEFVSYITICIPFFLDVVHTQVYCCHNMLLISLDFILVPSVVCFSAPLTELHAQTCIYCIAFDVVRMCIVHQENKFVYKDYILLFYQVSCMSIFPLVSYINQHPYSHCPLL